jgi:hypothetical protein
MKEAITWQKQKQKVDDKYVQFHKQIFRLWDTFCTVKLALTVPLNKDVYINSSFLFGHFHIPQCFHMQI